MCDLNLKLLILSLLIIYAPVIYDWMGAYGKLICIRCDDAAVTTQLISKALFRTATVNGTDNLAKVVSTLANENSSGVIVNTDTVSKQKLRELMPILLSLSAKAGVQKDGECWGTPIAVIGPVMACDITDNNFQIFINDTKRLDFNSIKHMLAYPSDFALVRHVAEENTGQEDDAMQKALKYAASFIYPYCKGNDRIDLYRGLLDCIDTMIQEDEDAHFQDGLVDDAIRAFNTWVRKNSARIFAYRLPYLGMRAEANLKKALYLDKQYVYMSTLLFDEIFQNIETIISPALLKAQLEQNDVLVCQEKGTFENKMSYYNVGGQYSRVRMLKFDSQRLYRPGMPRFTTIITIQEEDL